MKLTYLLFAKEISKRINMRKENREIIFEESLGEDN